jgi:peroxiredoxin Q/BCP
MKKLQVGDPAPSFSLPTQNRTKLSLSDLKGKTIVLYFYPRDMTPGCTTEACAFRDDYPELEKRGIQVLGVSPDHPQSHAKFAQKYKLPFELLADQDKKVIKDYGVWVEKSMYGKKYMGVERSTFVIGKNGKIQAIFRKVKPAQHPQELLEFFQSLNSDSSTLPSG